MSIEKKSFGLLASGEETSLFILKAGEIIVTLTDYGATLVSILLPDGRGGKDDILLGCSTLSGYAGKHPYFGATVGRYANRIGRSRFSLGGKEYLLAANDGINHLHGGHKGFNSFVWKADASENAKGPSLRFSRTSPDGEEGYPGTLDVAVTVILGLDGALSISYEARTSADTVVNLTNHSYFNLRGEGTGSILDHELALACSKYIPVNSELIPIGEPIPVAGGPFDFRAAKKIGKDVVAAGGYDHCFVLDRVGPGLLDFADVREPLSRRRMTAATTLPGVQLYSGNFLSAFPGKRGSLYEKHGGFCLETQLFPDSPNKPSYPMSLLRPGQEWKHETVYRFYP
ncbi:MAG: aldose epimerase family protein [Rectinemataceae bacterium]|jgi:aldose 1-epimerase